MGFESEKDIWIKFAKFTPYSYRRFLKKLHSKNKYSRLISSYAQKKLKDPPKALSDRDLTSGKLSIQNVGFIENAIETYEASLKVSDNIKPLLYHYSWLSFFAFLMYSLMKFHGRASGHGISISKMDRDEIKLDFKKVGFFHRILDVITILGFPSAFARLIPKVEKDGRLIFVENILSPLANIRKIKLIDIITFDEDNYFEKLCAQEGWIKNIHRYKEMEKCVRSFVMLFTASNITRYRPQIWSEMLEGERKFASLVITEVKNAYETYLHFVTLIHNTFEPFL